MGCEISSEILSDNEPIQEGAPQSQGDEILIKERLHNAILENNVDKCRHLLETHSNGKFSVFQSFPHEYVSRSPPLHMACMYRRPEIVQLLVDFGADVSALDLYGRTPCNICLQYWPRIWPDGKFHFFNESDIEENFWRSLHEQIYCASSILEILLKWGADGSERISTNNQSLLHFAAKKELRDAMKVLIQNGSDINIRDENMCTPLVVAAKHGRLRSVHFLALEGADTSLGDVNGFTFLHYLCNCERLTTSDLQAVMDVVRVTDINQTNSDGQTVLHITAFHGNGEKIGLLLQNGCNANIKDKKGRTALFCLLDNCDPSRCLLGIECLLMETVQISIQDLDTNYPMCFSKYHTNLPLFLKDILVMSKTPPSLFYLCVQKVRHTLGRKRQDIRHLSQLQLPGVIMAEIVLVSNFMNLPLLFRKRPG